MKLPRLQDIFALYRHIFCTCECGHVFRLSDAQIVARDEKPPRDWLSRLSFAVERLERRRDAAAAAFDAKRKDILDRERRRAEELCDDAVRRVIPNFDQLAVSSADVKALFSPVRFVAFDGLSQRAPRRIRFLDSAPASREHERVHRAMERVIRDGKLGWSTIRVGEGGEISREST